LTFTLRDPNQDGKVHFDELPTSYGQAFTMSGQLDYNVSGYLKYVDLTDIPQFRTKKDYWTFDSGTFTA
jgi:hypothetical protein